MPYGRLTEKMVKALVPHVRDRIVHDLGAGDCYLAESIIEECHAKRVVAIDKCLYRQPLPENSKVQFVDSTFTGYKGSPRLVFLSWPVNYHVEGLLRLVEGAKKVIYLGSNTDGNACGFPELFDHLLHRRLLVEVPHRRNTMLILGGVQKGKREPTHEEWAGLSMDADTPIMPYVGPCS
jgi:hypothetical protein